VVVAVFIFAVSPPRQACLQPPRCKVPLLYAPPIYCPLPISFVPCLLQWSPSLLHVCCCVFPIPRLLNIYVVFHLFAWSVHPPNYLPDRLASAGTVSFSSSRMPTRDRILVSAPGPSSLSMEHGRLRGYRPGRRHVVPSAGGSLPSWIVGKV
jgi:hypothetical protein